MYENTMNISFQYIAKFLADSLNIQFKISLNMCCIYLSFIFNWRMTPALLPIQDQICPVSRLLNFKFCILKNGCLFLTF